MPPLQPRLILALDASSGRCSAVLWAEERAGSDPAAPPGRVVAGVEHTGQSGDAARLPRMVADLMAEHGVVAGALSALAVTVGPGSFTGLRASLALAQGLALGAGLPVVPVTVAEALAVAARAEGGLDAASLWCALDGRQGRLFLHRGGAAGSWEAVPVDQPPLPEGPVSLTGDAAEALGRSLAARGIVAHVTGARQTDAASVAVAAMRRMAGLLPPLAVAPIYVDPPRALPPKGGLRPPPAPPTAA